MEELPRGWVNVPASDLFSFITSGSRGWAAYYADEGAAFIRVQNVRRGHIELSFDDVQHVRPPAGIEGARTRLRAGDLAITITADLGRVGLVPDDIGEAYVNQHVALARPADARLAAYLAWFFTSPHAQEQLGLLDRGATRSGLGLKDIGAVRVPLPPLAEQLRIVARIEALFARTRRARAELGRVEVLADRYAEQALTAAFTPAEDDCAGAVEIGGLLSEPPTNGISVRGSDEPPGTPALRLDALGPDALDLDRVRYIDIPSSTVQRLRVREGDFFASRGNGSLRLLARGAFAGAPAKDTVFPDTMIRLRFDLGRVVPAWLRLAWASRPVRAQIEARAKTTAGIWKVSQSDLASIRVHLPDLDQQRSVAERLGADLGKVAASWTEATRALALLDRLEAAILARAFRGELMPQDLADEPAALLARARAGTDAQPRRARRAA